MSETNARRKSFLIFPHRWILLRRLVQPQQAIDIGQELRQVRRGDVPHHLEGLQHQQMGVEGAGIAGGLGEGVGEAAGTRKNVAASAGSLTERGLAIADCRDADERCYPLGNTMFHLLGDVTTRRNWGAGNTSYVERDLQDRMRGFDDHAAVVSVTDAEGRTVNTIRRDYRALLPLLRHRRQPGHRAVKGFMAGTRDVTLAIDAPLQVRVARILEKYASRTSTGRAAAVVIDPDTGELLASVSYPLPGAGEADEGGEQEAAAASVFDRARYGLYAPGSTFKLVTAVAALRLDAANWRRPFMCTRQDPGRVGARVPGYGLVRDDEQDQHPPARS